MPLFEFRCERCHRVEPRLYPSYDQMVKEPAVRCVGCGSRMERLVSAPAFTVTGFSAANNYGVKS